MPKLEVNSEALRAALIRYTDLLDQTQNHIHLRIGSDGIAYASEEVGYCVGLAEFDRKPGHTITVMHRSGSGQCHLPEGWETTSDGISSIDELVKVALKTLDQRIYSCGSLTTQEIFECN